MKLRLGPHHQKKKKKTLAKIYKSNNNTAIRKKRETILQLNYKSIYDIEYLTAIETSKQKQKALSEEK